MTDREIIVNTLKANGAMKASDIAKVSNIDKVIVDKELNVLKKEGKIVSPKRCYWTLNE